MTVEIVPVMASVVGNPLVVWDPDFVLQEPKLKTLEARGWRQVFPARKHTSKHTAQSASHKFFIAEAEMQRKLFMSSPKVKKVQGSHCF